MDKLSPALNTLLYLTGNDIKILMLFSACDLKCNINNVPICVGKKNLCDGRWHCDDGQDEKNCGGCKLRIYN